MFLYSIQMSQLMESFGFTHAMDKLGVEHRLLVSGQNK